MRKYFLLFITIFFLIWIDSIFAKPKIDIYAIAKGPTPVLYSPDFQWVFWWTWWVNLKFDDYWEIDELEFIALSWTVFKVSDAYKTSWSGIILKVETKDYPYSTEKWYYIDYRFVKLTTKKPVEREKILPSKTNIIKKLLTASWSIYTWWWNYNYWIPELLKYYPPSWEINEEIKNQWMLKWVDCTGLLYEATNWYTPRNSSDIVKYGTWLEITGKKRAEDILDLLKPLDIIAWSGHIIIVLNKKYTIESRLDYDTEKDWFQWWVRIRNLKEVLDEVLLKRIWVNNYDDQVPEWKKKFIIRRWID